MSILDSERVSLFSSAAGPERKQDRRSRRTRHRLSEALMELLAKKPISSITVTELTELADVNRATFYSHYRDVHDMIDQLKYDGYQVMQAVVDKHSSSMGRGDYRGLVTDMVAYVDQNADKLYALMGPNGDGSFLEDISGLLRQAISDAVARTHPELARPMRLNPGRFDYQFSFIAGGAVGILGRWLAQGRPEPARYISDVLVSYIDAIPLEMLTDDTAMPHETRADEKDE